MSALWYLLATVAGPALQYLWRRLTAAHQGRRVAAADRTDRLRAMLHARLRADVPPRPDAGPAREGPKGTASARSTPQAGAVPPRGEHPYPQWSPEAPSVRRMYDDFSREVAR